jgi:acetyl-CoA decarbonylase/synthase complex subunit gamma
MALTGIQIFKLLPKTNCGDCGVPTCLAFAMILAAGKTELAACPHLSAAARAELAEAAAPPIRTVVIGRGESTIKVGGETVLFRHEKRFENPPGVAVLIGDTMSEAEAASRLDGFKNLRYERVGLKLRPELIAIRAESGDPGKFQNIIKRAGAISDAALILMSESPDIMKAGLEESADARPLLYAATADNLETMAELAKTYDCPLAVKGLGLEETSRLTTRLAEMGIKDMVIDAGAKSVRQALEEQVIIRSAAVSKKFRPLGYPTICFPTEMTADPTKEALIAAMFVAKYGGIIVLADLKGESLFPLLVARMNLYTDPQRPLATTQGIYEIGGPHENSPVLITANFSLTYFIVSGEIETSKVPSWLLVKDTEGLSVLTAWAAGKFGADTIAPFIKKSGIEDRVSHRKLVIPGYLAAESGGLEEELPGWEILIGPREGAHIPAYLKTWRHGGEK